MTPTPLVIGPAERAALAALRDVAAAHPVDMPRLMEVIETPEGKAAYMRQMNGQSVPLPLHFLVTFSIETGHPCGTCRHMSMSSRPGRLPTSEAVIMVAEHLGFVGGLGTCTYWIRGFGRTRGGREHRAAAFDGDSARDGAMRGG